MKFTTLIPIYFNDGGEVPSEKLQAMIDEFTLEFGGCSDEGITKGQWLDPANATLFRDECRRISVVCDRTMLDEARAAVIRIGRQLRQRAMYFEVRDYDGVQILEIPFA
ncbi:MAG: hypothetical protein ABI614_25230 [Planctomycetota bacterium]